MTPARWLAVVLSLALVLTSQFGCTLREPSAPPIETPSPTASPIPTPAPTNTPRATATPAPTPATETSPVPPQRTGQGTAGVPGGLENLLAVVPEGFAAVQFLDVKAVRETPELQSIGALQVPQFLTTLPPGTLSLIDQVLAAVSTNPQGVLISIEGPIDVEGLLEVALSYGSAPQEVKREIYKGYSISLIDLSGALLAGAAVGDTISVIFLGSAGSGGSGLDGIKSAIDAYAGTTPRMLDNPRFAALLASLAPGVTASLTRDCALTSPTADGVKPLECEATAFSIDLVDTNALRVSGVAVFEDVAQAATALELVADGLVVGGKKVENVATYQEGGLLGLSFQVEAAELTQILTAFDGFQIGPVQ